MNSHGQTDDNQEKLEFSKLYINRRKYFAYRAAIFRQTFLYARVKEKYSLVTQT